MNSIKQWMLAGTLLATAAASAAPHYENEESRRVVEAMVAAHGGLERWQKVPSIRFDNVMHNNVAGAQEFAWWVAHEVIDQETRHAYQSWPFDDASMGFDGTEVWSLDWKRANPPAFMVHFFYYFLNLPWLTQDDGVTMGEVSRFTWPGLGVELLEVPMRFEAAPTVGKTAGDYFVLYIDPTSYRLVGYQYAVGYRPMLDVMGVAKDRALFGPMWRLITRYETVDGLVFPSAWRTMPEPEARIVGNHVIMNIDVSQPFDASAAERPEGGRIHNP